MEELNKYKDGLKSYRKGFGIGLLIGTGVCLALGKPLLFIPVCLALVLGSVFLEKKIADDGSTEQ
jgi:hypothetical protein